MTVAKILRDRNAYLVLGQSHHANPFISELMMVMMVWGLARASMVLEILPPADEEPDY